MKKLGTIMIIYFALMGVLSLAAAEGEAGFLYLVAAGLATYGTSLAS